MQLLQDFNNKPFIDALQLFFSKKLSISYVLIDKNSTSAKSILKEKYNENAHQIIKDVYVFGFVDEETIKNPNFTKWTVEKINKINYCCPIKPRIS